jgi:hypothetical protein
VQLSGKVLAYCYLGEDAMVERIADILSSKYLGGRHISAKISDRMKSARESLD